MFTSCTVGYDLANQFANKPHKGAVLVLSPDIVFKTNLKDTISEKYPGLSQEKIDDLLISQSLFLKFLNEQRIADLAVSHLKDELLKSGFEVYDESSTEEFLQRKDTSYILKFSQLQLEEGLENRHHTDVFGDWEYSSYVVVNFVNINSWFEFERTKVEEEYPVLYASMNISDAIIGRFEEAGNGSLEHVCELDSLQLKDFEELPKIMGKTYAQYFYDYVMNLYVLENSAHGKSPSFYLHYNPQSKLVTPVRYENEMFTEIVL